MTISEIALPADSASDGSTLSATIRRAAHSPLVLVGAACALWVARYAISFGLHLTSPAPWAHAFDQARYVASAHALAMGNLTPSEHWYPLAYSIVAAPFTRVLPNQPFFIPDMILFGVTLLGFQRAMRAFGLGPLAATVSFLLGYLVIYRTAKLWLEPWTTTLSAPLLWWLIAIAIEMVVVSPARPMERRSPSPKLLFLTGLLAGALPLVRPTDCITAGILLVFMAIGLARHRRLTVRATAAVILGGAAVAIPYLTLHVAIYGFRLTPYEIESAKQGFAFADLPWKFAVIVVSPRPWYTHATSLIEGTPWIVPGLAGLVLAACSTNKRARGACALIACIAIPYCALFLAYTDLQPPGLWPMHNAHYFKWLFPLLTAGCWLWLKAFATRRGAALALGALALVIAPACLRPLPMLVGDNTPARMLLFKGSDNRPFDTAYFAPATITDDAGTLLNVRRFHQVPDNQGERAIAVTRLFVGPAIRRDPGEPAQYAGPQKPYARYAVRLSLGLPCWFGKAVCPLPAASF